VVYCTGKYYNDGYYVNQRRDGYGDPAFNFKCKEKEGVKDTYFDFNTSEDGSIPGMHQEIKNVQFWAQSCLGISALCSESCEGIFMECMNKKETRHTTQKDRAENFPECIKEMDNEGACKGCAATLKMLKMSEVPITEYGTDRLEKPTNMDPIQGQKPVFVWLQSFGDKLVVKSSSNFYDQCVVYGNK